MIAICPVCKGSGKYTEPNDTTAGPQERTCHGCEGKGWVSDTPPYSIQPWPYSLYPYQPWPYVVYPCEPNTLGTRTDGPHPITLT